MTSDSDEKKPFERQIDEIVDKDALHRMIDTMTDGDQMLLLIFSQDTQKWNVFGQPTHERLIYMMESFKHFLLAPESES